MCSRFLVGLTTDNGQQTTDCYHRIENWLRGGTVKGGTVRGEAVERLYQTTILTTLFSRMTFLVCTRTYYILKV